MINYGKQHIDQEDIRAVVDTLQSDWLTQGPKIPEFEDALAEYCGAKYAIAVSSGTAALHLAALAMDIQIDQKVITSPITFVATSNAVIYAGGIPLFADIQPNTFNINTNEILIQIESNDNVKGIIPVHFAGLTPDLEMIYDIAKQEGLWIIEDACHALGGKWRDSNDKLHRVGDCSHSNLTVFSFHPVKQITTGEGGAILTNDEMLYKRIKTLRTHGVTKDPKDISKSDGEWYYEMHSLGYNYRMTDIQAALGNSQLQKNDEWVKRRNELVQKYDDAFADNSYLTPQIHTNSNLHSYHLYVVKAEKRAELYSYLKGNGIHTQVHYIPVHLQPYYREMYGYKPGDYPHAEAYYDHALSLPLYPSIQNAEQEYVIQTIIDFYGAS